MRAIELRPLEIQGSRFYLETKAIQVSKDAVRVDGGKWWSRRSVAKVREREEVNDDNETKMVDDTMKHKSINCSVPLRYEHATGAGGRNVIVDDLWQEVLENESGDVDNIPNKCSQGNHETDCQRPRKESRRLKYLDDYVVCFMMATYI
ncbi:hypothetical protein NDU88_001406 [Pleurodeles waltl]|uniref:Uncharacterized protein n=1 Tax=Pleurodeles waltl TaxID=8319 RepID=A0AAV7LFV0_PLEWA|nr:hypothetical protein NDU88_001406 [Pleurodeles waltl]